MTGRVARYSLTEEREALIRALIRKPLEEWPRHEPHACVAELLDEIERLRAEVAKGCCRCGRRVHKDGSTVTWVCCVCGCLVCQDCTLALPLDHPDYTGIPGTVFEVQYYDDTFCSKMCMIRHNREASGEEEASA